MLNGRNRRRTRSAPRLPVRWGPSPFTRVVGLPQSSNARHDNAYSKLTVHGCSEVGRQSYASLGGVGSSQSMVHGYPYQLPHTSVLASDHEPNRRIPYTRSVASDCGGRKVTGVPSQCQASYLPQLRAHTHALASLQKREIGLRLLRFRSDASAPDPCGMWPPYYQGHDPYGFGYGIRLPVRPWGVPPTPPRQSSPLFHGQHNSSILREQAGGGGGEGASSIPLCQSR